MPIEIIDTHLHLVYLDRFSYPWLGEVPALNRDFTLETYRPQAEAAGIAQAIHMEVDVAEADQMRETDFVTGLDDIVVAAISSCRPERADFPVRLERLGANPKVKGLRRILHTSPDELSQETRSFATPASRGSTLPAESPPGWPSSARPPRACTSSTSVSSSAARTR